MVMCLAKSSTLWEMFTHEFKQNYQITSTTRRCDTFLLDQVDARYVVDVAGDGSSQSTNTVAWDLLEQYALSVPAPGKSLRSADSQVHTSSIFWTFYISVPKWLMLSKATGRIQLQDCQTWVQAYVAKLVEVGILHNNTNTVVAAAPMNWMVRHGLHGIPLDIIRLVLPCSMPDWIMCIVW